MAQRYPRSPRYEFGGYRFDPTQGILFKGADVVPCDPKACELLHAFLRRKNELLTFDELIHDVWQDADVDNAAVTFQVHRLRRVLEDNATDPKFIRTVRRQGFIFVGKVRSLALESEAANVYEVARHFHHKSTPASVLAAIHHFEKVIALDQ